MLTSPTPNCKSLFLPVNSNSIKAVLSLRFKVDEYMVITDVLLFLKALQ